MNKFELDKTMEVLGYESPGEYEYSYITGKYETPPYNYLGKYNIFLRNYYCVTSNVNKTIAEGLFKKYNNSKYKIRVDGDNEHKIPYGSCFYHIDTLEGLVAFLYETAYYETHGHIDESYEGYLKLLTTVYRKILDNMNVYQSINDYMINNPDYIKTYLDNRNDLDFNVRSAIQRFDSFVNPFENRNTKIYRNKYEVSGFRNEDKDYNALYLELGDVSLRTIKEDGTFVNRLQIGEDYGETNLYHYFSDGAETFAVDIWDEKRNDRREYDITHRLYGKQYEKKHPVRYYEKQYVIDNIDKYLGIAQKRIHGLDYTKTLTRKKKDSNN